MGTDSVTLFNKRVADRILTMDVPSLITFLEENIEALEQKAFAYNLVGFEMKQRGASISDAVRNLLVDEYTLDGLKADLVRDFGFGDEEMHIDYWGCYAKVFIGHPAGAISSLDYLPDEEEETFLLLQPNHVTQMIDSLKLHLDDVSIMDEDKIKRLATWRDTCLANPDYMVAYHFDF